MVASTPRSSVSTAGTTQLPPYTGPFGRAEAAHLLRRTLFGATPEQIDTAVSLGLGETVRRLLETAPYVGDPVNDKYEGDPNVPIGATWIRAPRIEGRDLRMYRMHSVFGWQGDQYLNGAFSVENKLSLFWLNMFGCEEDGGPRMWYRYISFLRTNAIGNYREFVRKVTVEPQMLRFLNGEANNASSPNENYARELLELFTLGKGPLVGPGDYSTYTEEDVRAISRALTGWKIEWSEFDTPAELPRGIFREDRHDAEPKQFSPRMGSAVIADGGAEEYSRVVDLIFEQPSIGYNLARRLYLWFVDSDVETPEAANVFTSLQETLKANDFEVRPMLRELLTSDYFFAPRRRAALIKNPYDYLADLHALLGFPMPNAVVDRYRYTQRFRYLATDQQMSIERPPSVAGWKAYHQEPLYHRSWINASSLAQRSRVSNDLIRGGVPLADGSRVRSDFLKITLEQEDYLDPGAVIRAWGERLLPVPLSEAQVVALKEVLIPGLPDFEWTVELQGYLDAPDEDMRRALERKLADLVRALVNVPEFHLS